MSVVTLEDLKNVLEKFSKLMYRAKCHDDQDEEMLHRCISLFSKDYMISIIKNDNGELSSHYPKKLIILEKEKNECCSNQSEQQDFDSNKIRETMYKARYARCRARFPIPVILFEGKSICRSGTLSGGPEIYGRSGYDFFFSGSENQTEEPLVDDNRLSEDERFVEDSGMEDEITNPRTKSEWQLFTKVRKQDIRLLKVLNVKYIVDLMVEKKKVKFGINVTSSEKVDKENRYSDFTILSLPYPGCEFFNEFRNRNHSGTGLYFDWSQPFVDAKLMVPHDNISTPLSVDWTEYRNWDIIKLTKNYLKLILRYIAEGKAGMLIHCISGWDRTPLYVSLVRLSLWADGKIHTSLGPLEIVYLTMVYDWYFYGAASHKATLRRNESDHLMDSILLESSLEVGSNTSLSSIGSTASNKSSVDGIPSGIIRHRVSSQSSQSSEANSHSSRNCMCRSQCLGVDSSSHNHDSNCQKFIGSTESDASTTTLVSSIPTSPSIPVPKRVNGNEVYATNSRFNDFFGSWQVISESGSLNGTAMMSLDSTNSCDWPPSFQQSGCLDSFGNMSSSKISSHHKSRKKRRPSTPNNRKRNLSTVRDIFNVMYRNTISSETSGVSYYLDQISEKIGFRSSKSSSSR
ncbi:Myotubularin-related protein 14 [Nymphon striatum]|nr:Myotubularin-related protein 14 [Nymphon striatum]